MRMHSFISESVLELEHFSVCLRITGEKHRRQNCSKGSNTNEGKTISLSIFLYTPFSFLTNLLNSIIQLYVMQI